MELLDVRDRLETLLTPELGTFANGSKSLWVEPPDPPPTGTGLHCFLDRTCAPFSTGIYQWRVALIQYDRSEVGLQSFDRAIRKVRDRFWCRDVPLPYRDDRYPEIRFSLLFPLTATRLEI